jgi:hypothetical protein
LTGQLESLKVLLAYDYALADGESPVTSATGKVKYEQLQVADHNEHTALLEACAMGHAEVVRLRLPPPTLPYPH